MRYPDYPVLQADLHAIAQNAKVICGLYEKQGISVAGVIKVSDGSPEIAGAYLDGGCRQLASSRICHLALLRKAFPNVPMLLLRIPQPCEVRDVVEYADYSLNSEASVLRTLNDAAGRLGKTHKVILMLDVGDRREGVTTVEDLAALASEVKRTMPYLEVAGVGTNYGCVSGVLPDDANLQMLCDGAEAVEAVLGHPLEIVSGGSSSSLIRSWKGLALPAKINHLRIGGAIANPNNIMINRGIEIPGANIDTFRLKVQIAECKEKTGVQGSGKNWKGETVHFDGGGLRRRAIAAVGSQDIGDPFNLLPVDPDVHVIAGSSDHTVLDVTDCKERVNVGDVLEFRLRYGGLLQIFSTKHVKIQFR
ncbi:MAG: alanine racemase [Firmicutes bacterium]|nr:alanine racemase [Bacillota bacterium]